MPESMDMNNRAKGSNYEDAAASFLIAKKYVILEKNYRKKTGEIDLIAFDEEANTLVFVEVKYRARKSAGYPEEAVTYGKQLRIMRTAQWYLMEKKIKPGTKCRFDVISILQGSIRHIKNAFGGF